MSQSLALTEAVYYILLSLCSPRHGYGIMQQTEQLSAGRVRLAPGTLYGALSSLCEKGWIVALPGTAGDRKKEYEISPLGRQVLADEIRRLQELLDNGRTVLGGTEND